MTVDADVLETYEFYVQISEEDVRDGDAGPWERVVAALAAEVRALRETLAESSVTTDDALRAWMGHMSGQAPDVKYAAALACIAELERENAALRGEL